MASSASTSHSTEDWEALDRRVLGHPWITRDVSRRILLVEGDGAWVTDSEGNRYLDAHGGAWLTQVGHGRRELAEIAAEQMGRLEHFTVGGMFTNAPAIQLADRILEVAPDNMAQVRFCSCGSEADDEALHFVHLYQQRLGRPERNVVLARRGGFHGRCYGGAALGGHGAEDGYGPLPGNVEMLSAPLPYHAELFDGQDVTDFCVAELEATIDRVGADRIAAMFAEPVMAPAGMVPPPEDYWPRISAVLQRHDIMLVLDEVVTAFGRSGEWFAANRYGLEADMIVTAKGIASGYMPLAAIILSGRAAEVLDGASGGGSYGGHPTACAVGLGSLEILAREDLVDNSRQVGEYLMGRLDELKDRHETIGDVHGIGLMIGVELVADRATRAPLPLEGKKDLEGALRDDYGLLTTGLGNTIALTPPLVLNREEADSIVASFDSLLARLSPDGTLAPLD